MTIPYGSAPKSTSTAAHIESIAGRQYRFQRWGRRWVVSLWCDCLFGPHWHETQHHGRDIAALRAAIRGGEPVSPESAG